MYIIYSKTNKMDNAKKTFFNAKKLATQRYFFAFKKSVSFLALSFSKV